MTLIRYDGRIAAVVNRRNVQFNETLSQRPEDDPERRFVYAMGIYARDIAAGEIPGSYREDDAELYARTLLMPDDEFSPRAGDSDECLAERFGVPVEQVAAKRRDAVERIGAPRGTV